MQQRLKLRRRAFGLGDDTGGGDIDRFQAAGDDVVAVEVPALEAEHAEVGFGPRALPHRHPQGEAVVDEHLAAVVLDAPGFEQPRQVGTHTGGDENALGRARHQRVGARVEKDDGPAAAQQMLVDGVEHLIGQVPGMREHDDIDVSVDGRVERADAAHIVQLADDVHDKPGLEHLVAGRVEAAIEIKPGEQAHDRTLGIGGLGDQLDELILEKRLLVGPDQGHGFRNAQGFRRAFGQWLGGNEAEVDRLAALGHRNRLDAELIGEILVFRKRLRVDHIQAQAAFAGDDDFPQQLLNPGGVGADLRHVLGGGIGVEEADLDGGFEARHDFPGRRGEGEQAIPGQIEAPARQQRDHRHREQQGEGDEGESDD